MKAKDRTALRGRWSSQAVKQIEDWLKDGAPGKPPGAQRLESGRWDLRGLKVATLGKGLSLVAFDLSASAVGWLSHNTLRDCVLAGSSVSELYKSALGSCDLQHVDLRGSGLRSTKFYECIMEGARLSGARLAECQFDRCTLVKCDFRTLQSTSNITFESCDCSGMQFGGGRFHDRVVESWTFTDCDLTGVEWNETDPSLATIVNCKGYPPEKT